MITHHIFTENNVVNFSSWIFLNPQMGLSATAVSFMGKLCLISEYNLAIQSCLTRISKPILLQPVMLLIFLGVEYGQNQVPFSHLPSRLLT
jgi:hypothetical protein